MSPEEFYTIFLRNPQISTDSRKITPGCLYFALRGEHFNGNNFAADAISQGAAFAVVDNPGLPGNDRFVQVPDVLTFLQELAKFHRSRLNIPVIGLTGTNGKTTTKELIHSVLRQKFRTVATAGNLNNHIGVPLTVLAADQDTEVLIVEMGANHPGEIAFLCGIARPNAGLITNIGMAHLEGFGSFEGVMRTKNEIYTALKASGGALFVNQDDDLLKSLAGNYPCFTYGSGPDADISGRVAGSDRYLEVNWKRKGSRAEYQVTSKLTGKYNISNILAAISIGAWLGLTDAQINEGIQSYVPGNMRSQWVKTEKNMLLLDAYNANPSSMALALEHFASLQVPDKVVILGDMFELGEQSADEHQRIIGLADQLGFETVLYAGPRFYEFAGSSDQRFFNTREELAEYLLGHPVNGSNVLIKGSRGMQLEKLAGLL